MLKTSVSIFLASLVLFLFQNCGDLDALNGQGEGSAFAASSPAAQPCSELNLGARNPQNITLTCQKLYENTNYGWKPRSGWRENSFGRVRTENNEYWDRYPETCGYDVTSINRIANALEAGGYVNFIGEVCYGEPTTSRVYGWVGPGNTGVGNQYTICTKDSNGLSPERCLSQLYQACSGGRAGHHSSGSTPIGDSPCPRTSRLDGTLHPTQEPNATRWVYYRTNIPVSGTVSENIGMPVGTPSLNNVSRSTDGGEPQGGSSLQTQRIVASPVESSDIGKIFDGDGLPFRILDEDGGHCRLENWTGVDKSQLADSPAGVPLNYKTYCD